MVHRPVRSYREMSSKQGADKTKQSSKPETTQFPSKKYESGPSQQTGYSSKGGRFTVDNFSVLVQSLYQPFVDNNPSPLHHVYETQLFQDSDKIFKSQPLPSPENISLLVPDSFQSFFFIIFFLSNLFFYIFSFLKIHFLSFYIAIYAIVTSILFSLLHTSNVWKELKMNERSLNSYLVCFFSLSDFILLLVPFPCNYSILSIIYDTHTHSLCLSLSLVFI
jgi:hypothetical protein